MRSKAWLHTINDLFVDHWENTEDMRKGTGLSYMRCKELLGGYVPKFEHIEALAAATKLTPTDIVALYEQNKADLAAEEAKEGAEKCKRQLDMFSETQVVIADSVPTGESGIIVLEAQSS